MPTWLILLALSATPGEHWPGFRGDGTSVTAARKLPTRWSDTENVAWSVELPGYGQSSPVVWGDRVFVTSSRGEKKETLLVSAFAAATGERLWSREFAGTQNVAVSDYVSRSAPTPAVDAERVYAFFESGDLVALNHAGDTVWQRSLVKDYGEFQGNHGIGTSLASTADSLVVLIAHNGPSYLLSVDKATGQNRWKVDREAKVSWSTPTIRTVGDRGEILISSSGAVDSYRPETGERLWWLTGLDGNTINSPTCIGDLVLIGSSKPNQNLAVASNGTGDVTATAVRWRTAEATSSFGSPLVAHGVAYFVNRSGVLFAVDPQTGAALWNERLPDACWASPLAAEDRVYFFGKGGQTAVYRSGREPERLVENTLTLEGRIYGVAAVNGAFFVRAGSRLWRLSEGKTPSTERGASAP
jgi:outer membrane protein assembly factor BamB